jgi:hypothetical protein
MNISTEACLRQHKAHTYVRTNGDKIFHIQGGVYDLFAGMGWENRSHFRIVKMRDPHKQPQMIQIGGVPLSQDYRIELLKELS